MSGLGGWFGVMWEEGVGNPKLECGWAGPKVTV